MASGIDKLQQRRDYLNAVRFIKITRNRLRSSSLEPIELRRLLTGALHLLREIMKLSPADSSFDYKKMRSDLEEICHEIRNYHPKSDTSQMSFEAANEEGGHIAEISEQSVCSSDHLGEGHDIRPVGAPNSASHFDPVETNDTTSAERIQYLLQQQKVKLKLCFSNLLCKTAIIALSCIGDI
jgi:hypothetical protein